MIILVKVALIRKTKKMIYLAINYKPYSVQLKIIKKLVKNRKKIKYKKWIIFLLKVFKIINQMNKLSIKK
jgi:hypothetical protein